jgi:hypothetical protein
MYTRKRILITKCLFDNGHNVIVVDNFYAGTKDIFRVVGYYT